MGAGRKQALRVTFDSCLKLEFHGAKVASGARLLACRELDAAQGLTDLGMNLLRDWRTFNNPHHSMVVLMRQLLFSRLAGYDDTNDAERLSVDPAMRLTSADYVTQFKKGITAFTLIELLVVIAIIGILAALLFPVLSRARQKGQQASCVNNARQQTLAVFMYADENSDVLPPVAYNDQNGNEVDWPTLLNPYLNSQNIHLCPNDLLSKLNSYGLSELGFVDLTDPGVTTPNRLMLFHTPTTTIMLGDVGTEDNFTTPRPDTFKMIAPGSIINDDGDARPSNRHAGRCDLGFIDGHAEPMQLWQFYTNQVPTNKWFTP